MNDRPDDRTDAFRAYAPPATEREIERDEKFLPDGQDPGPEIGLVEKIVIGLFVLIVLGVGASFFVGVILMLLG
jgi:hypothetical protein